MRLSKIKLSGFKSFVDPTTISFPTNLTGIVGPNGCGKSNVIDAIRWVLGESSAKTLRGDSMADVIFNGSSGRKPVGQAGIELVFDNSDGTIAGAYAGYSEVSVRRVVSRDGTSQYFLNNGRCRRKDITNILLGTGVGSHGYSIIEQGMISRLVEAKPEELRSFLEEAAGISKYKERRRDTEHRIRHTRDNLERLTDIRDELEKQLAHLKRQANAAERYKTLKAEERQTNAELLLLRLNDLRSGLGQEEAGLREKQLVLEAAVTAEREVETRIERLRVALSERHDTFNEAQGVYYKVGADIARLEQAIQHRKSTIGRRESDLSDVTTQIDQITGHLDDDRGQLEALEASLGQLNPELDEATQSLSEVEQELAELESAVERHRSRADELARNIANAERLAQVDQVKIDQFAERQIRVEADRAEQATLRSNIRLDDYEARIEELVGAEERQRGERAELARSIDGLTGEIRALRQQQTEAAERLDAKRERLQSSRGQLKALEALQAAAVRKLSSDGESWLAEKALADDKKLAERLDVHPGWERAIESALNQYFHAVEVADIAAISDGLGGLAESGLALIEAQPESGAVGIAPGLEPLSNRISGPAAAVALLDGLFAAESVEAALNARSRLSPGQALVTRDGVVVSRHGVLTVSPDDPQLGVIARGEEIDRMRSEVASLAQSCDETTGELADLKARLDGLEDEVDSAQNRLASLQASYTDTRTELEATRARAEEARQRRRELDRSIVGLEDELFDLVSAVEKGRGAVESAITDKGASEEALAAHEDEGEVLMERFAEVRQRVQVQRERAKEIAIMVESRRSSKASAAAALSRVQSQLEHLEKRRVELDRQLTDARQPLADEEQEVARLLDRNSAAETALGDARSAVEQCESDVRSAESERVESQQRVAEARDAVDAVRLAVRETQVRADTVSEQLEATGFDPKVLGEGLPEDADAEGWSARLESIGRRIQRLGSINLAAIDEFEEQSERKAYLDKQFDDLSAALETLEAAIRKIDRQTRQRFKDTFDKTNQGLGRLFPRLFGGGQAYLELTGDDLLSAGVTVMARPPGKRISTIHLMSGGEKALTAVALVFSIFELNPAPFCLLDEVDAPLDDANVGRFSDIVREMSEQVQFVLITHNKTTMESMNQLAGVTMHEPGVSRLVAVDIDEAVKLAAM